MYFALKALHLLCAALTVAGFMLRGWWALTESPRLRYAAVRIAPHVVDTLLLASGVALVFELQAGAWLSSWLPAKLAGIVVYILLGFVTLRFAHTVRARAVGLTAALTAFAYVVGTAITKSPASWIAYATL